MSYILRHGPEKYGLTLDSQGFVSLAELADAPSVQVDHIREVAKTSQDLRFEILGEKIRARYGHFQEVTLQ